MNPNNPNPNNEQEAEVMPPSAIMALERASIDSQVATAHQLPRSIQRFKAAALSMATLDAETADDCVYCRPVGKEKNERGQWVQKFAEGPSIRLAEIVACNYGNLRVASRIVEQTERFVRCEGVAHDLETNYAGKSECVESTVTKDGIPYSERQRALMAKVCLSKAYRDAIFKVVPRALCKPVYEAAVRTAAGQGQTIEQRRNKAKAWLASKKIDEVRMFAALGIGGWDDVGEDQLRILTGLKTSITDGDTTLDEAFPIPTKEAADHPPGAEPVTEAAKKAKAKEAKPQKPQEQTAGPGKPPQAATEPQQQPPQQEATKPAEQAAAAPAQKPTFTAEESAEALASVKALLQEAGLTEETFMRYAEANKFAKKGQNKLDQLATSKLVQIGSVFGRILPEIKKFQEQPA